MAEREVEAAAGPDVTVQHLGEHGAADDVARGPLLAPVVAVHETFAVAVEEVGAEAAQAFLQDGAGDARLRARHQTGRMELHHLHVAERDTGAQRHGEAVAGLVAGRRVVAVHGRPAAGGEQHRLGADEGEGAGPHVDHYHAGEGAAITGADQLHRPVVLEAADRSRPHLLGKPVDDLDAGEVALVDGAVEGLPGEGLLVHGAVRVAVEEATELVLELAHAHPCAGDQRPGEILVVEPLAPLDRVHEVALHRVLGRQRHVVAALHHSGAAALAEQTLDGDGQLELGRRRLRVKRGEESRPAGAEDEDVRVEAPQAPSPMAASAAARRSRARSLTVS